MNKVCLKCGIEKPIEDFTKSRILTDGYLCARLHRRG